MAFQFEAMKSQLRSSKADDCKDCVDYSKKSLKLDDANAASQIIKDILACQSMVCLNLQGNTLGIEAAQAIGQALKCKPELKIAKWADLFTGRMKTEIPVALSALSDGMIIANARLKVLDLSDNAFGPIGVSGLANLLQSQVCSELEELYLNNNGLGITGGTNLCEAILASKFKPKLKVLVAGRNRLENDGALQLARVFNHLGTLEVISIPQNGIYHKGITALSKAFENNPELQSLNLNDNTIGPKGTEAFVNALPKLKKLKNINFGDCLLKTKGARTLAKALKDNNTELETLDLSANEINNETCESLLDSAKFVNLRSNKLGQELRETLRIKGMLDDSASSGEEFSSSDESSDASGSEHEDKEDDDTYASETNDSKTDIRLESDLDLTVISTDGHELVKNFLLQPSLINFERLGPWSANLFALGCDPLMGLEEQATKCVELLVKTSGLSMRNPAAKETALTLWKELFKLASKDSGIQWHVTNLLLTHLGLMKSEDKTFKIRWDLVGCFSILSEVIDDNAFPSGVKGSLMFFIENKKSKDADAPFMQFKNLVS